MTFKLNKAQALGVEHLMAHKRAMLFAGLGVGKTLTVLKAFCGLRLTGEAETMLVVAPLRVCNLTWPNEISDWPEHFGDLRVANLRTPEGWKAFLKNKADLYLCNYEMLPKVAEAFVSGVRCPDIVCFDEMTKAKNPKSKRIEAIRSLLPERTRRWGMTATPSPNGYLDLFAQVRLIDDGQRLGRSFDQYKRMYFHPIDYMEYDWRLNEGAAGQIEAKISDLCLTLLSEEFGINVPSSEVDIEVPLPEEAQKQYKTLEKELILSLGDDPDNPVIASSAGVLVNKLLQICSGAAYREDKLVVELHDAKVEAAKKYLKTVEGPTLIVYNYRHELERLKKALPEAEVFENAKNHNDQLSMVERWNEGYIDQMLVHPKAMSHGLNLQHGGADVLWFSPTWSPEDYDQLNGRLARQGQKRHVTIARLLCPGTMDEVAVETLHDKHDGQRALLTALKNLQRLNR